MRLLRRSCAAQGSRRAVDLAALDTFIEFKPDRVPFILRVRCLRTFSSHQNPLFQPRTVPASLVCWAAVGVLLADDARLPVAEGAGASG